MFVQHLTETQWHKLADDGVTALCGQAPEPTTGWERSSSHVYLLEYVEPDCRQLMTPDHLTLVYGQPVEAPHG